MLEDKAEKASENSKPRETCLAFSLADQHHSRSLQPMGSMLSASRLEVFFRFMLEQICQPLQNVDAEIHLFQQNILEGHALKNRQPGL